MKPFTHLIWKAILIELLTSYRLLQDELVLYGTATLAGASMPLALQTTLQQALQVSTLDTLTPVQVNTAVLFVKEQITLLEEQIAHQTDSDEWYL